MSLSLQPAPQKPQTKKKKTLTWKNKRKEKNILANEREGEVMTPCLCGPVSWSTRYREGKPEDLNHSLLDGVWSSFLGRALSWRNVPETGEAFNSSLPTCSPNMYSSRAFSSAVWTQHAVGHRRWGANQTAKGVIFFFFSFFFLKLSFFIHSFRE